MTTTSTTMTIKLADLEQMMRRVVREVVREELVRQSRSASNLYDLNHEGPADAEGDEAVLREALDELETYGERPDTWTAWEDLEVVLDRAEAAGELPD